MAENDFVEEDGIEEGAFIEATAENGDEALAEALDDDMQDIEGEQLAPKKKHVTGQDLYETIVRHPDWRVVQASDNADSMHPLMFLYDGEGGMMFQHDFAATQLHPHGSCADILDLLGTEGLPDAYARKPVLIGELYIEDWKADGIKVRKVTLDSSAKWIKLHIFK